MADPVPVIRVGQVLESPRSYTPTEAQIIQFASQWDPFPWHMDPEAARQSVYGGLTAPGVMIDAVLIRLIHGTVPWPKDAIVGMIGAESVRYVQAVRPGDELRIRGEVVSLTPSQSNPQRTVGKIAWEMRRADGQLVYARTNVILFQTRYCEFVA